MSRDESRSRSRSRLFDGSRRPRSRFDDDERFGDEPREESRLEESRAEELGVELREPEPPRLLRLLSRALLV